MANSTNEKQGCLSTFFPFLKRFTKTTSPQTLPYRVRDDFLSPAELSFYRVLSPLIGTEYTLQSKIRLADIFFVARPNENVGSFNRIAQRHVDFLVCDSSTMKPLFGIELDDASHRRNDRQDRDAFVESVFAVAELPLIRVPVQREYNSKEIANLITPYLKVKVNSPQPLPQPESTAPAGSAPYCPKCGIPMVLRTVSHGEHKGKQFYGCQNYPSCREMKPYLG